MRRGPGLVSPQGKKWLKIWTPRSLRGTGVSGLRLLSPQGEKRDEDEDSSVLAEEEAGDADSWIEGKRGLGV